MYMDTTSQHMMVEAGYYPIGTVSGLTGVNAVTLRAWERRYGLVKPKRTPKGHRMYKPGDVEMIRQILRLIEQGIPISQVRVALSPGSGEVAESDSTGVWLSYLDGMVAAISQFDEAKLDGVYQEAMALYPVDVVTKQLLMPLLTVLGDRWEKNEGSIAEEHFFGVYMRNKLGARFHHRRHHAHGPRLLVACLPGEYHEVGLLLMALAAHDRGYRVVMLGADMPLEQLPHVVQNTRVDAVVLSSSVEPLAGTLGSALPKLVKTISVPVFMGGQTSVRYRDSIERAGVHALGTELIVGLELMGDILSAPLVKS